ncbi:hypothetical protein N7489_001485 [Penicillium chrysogenum]|uniref:Uncharacterized protein n=1 Tax=Penicillium chrysogenum TaxID=5076 RepID=A0ABQ8WJ38_PENCH|nr:uncharacterized protein N7489_001485 [Penicillium chrysogenum]KAJ5251075.1 hypothetical protein N7489_001485 [Penicillium chrysogenum]KAJ5262512.1 hypothetical protein N7524_007817 [Penicillium chrysogenum]KAJ5269976.1 hypothetical protein N7505_005734 [Penicillium chrysogenum]KAJ6147291.1 hypothetical protein N7497_009273 [Penicillium chrysogenum]
MEKSIEIDPAYYDLGRDDYVDSDFASEATSLSSSIYRGVFENGRRCPSDEQQFESLEAGCVWLPPTICKLTRPVTYSAYFWTPIPTTTKQPPQ